MGMKRFCLVVAIICQSRGEDVRDNQARMLGRSLPFDNQLCDDPPCSPPVNPPLSRTHSQQYGDCLLCYSPQCVNCPKRFFQSSLPCAPCVSPPCPPCLKAASASPDHFPPPVSPSFPTTHSQIRRSLERQYNESTPDAPEECTPMEIEAMTNELIDWTGMALRKACFHYRPYLRPSYSPVNVACFLQGGGYLSYIRQYLPEVLGYLYRHFLLPRNAFQPLFVVRVDANGRSVVLPNPRQVFCPQQD